MSEAYCSVCGRWSPSGDWVVGLAAVCPLCGHHHPPLDPPTRVIIDKERTGMSDVDLETRWQAFSDEELLELRAGCEERWERKSLPIANRNNATELSAGIAHELWRRRGRYRGPGVYRDGQAGGEYEVYGVLEFLGEGQMVVVRPDPESDALRTVPRAVFERPMPDGHNSYEFARALGEDPS